MFYKCDCHIKDKLEVNKLQDLGNILDLIQEKYILKS